MTFVSIGQSFRNVIFDCEVVFEFVNWWVVFIFMSACEVVFILCQLWKLSSVLSQLRLSSFLCQFVRLSFISILS